MKRYYSHYTYIYPDTYLQNTVVELDEANNIKNVYPFEKEIEKTEFRSGLLFFVPNTLRINPYFIDYTKKKLFEKIEQDFNSEVEVNAIICNLED